MPMRWPSLDSATSFWATPGKFFYLYLRWPDSHCPKFLQKKGGAHVAMSEGIIDCEIRTQHKNMMFSLYHLENARNQNKSMHLRTLEIGSPHNQQTEGRVWAQKIKRWLKCSSCSENGNSSIYSFFLFSRIINPRVPFWLELLSSTPPTAPA